MPKKLKLVLKNHKGWLLPLASKTIVFSLLLFLTSRHWPFIFLFLPVIAYFYFRPSLNNGQFIFSFLILITLSFLTINLLSYWPLAVSLFFGALLFILLGIKNLIFINRQPFYYFLNGFLLLIIFIFFFQSENLSLFFLKYLAVFLVTAFLAKEFLTFSITERLSTTKKTLVVYGTAFLILQLLWAISLLPLGFLNAASLALLIALILQDFIIHHFSGTLNRQVILRNITLFLILSLVIFGASRWRP